MAAYFSFSKLASAALIGSVMTGSLLGCQPSKDTDTATSEEVTTVDEHAEHDHEGHDEHEGHEEHAEHADHDGHEGHDHDEHEGHDHASAGTPFVCEPTATIGVSYHNDSTPQTANLLIDGLEYDLTATADSEADKAIYMSDIGLDDTHGIIWQVNGDKATLLNKTLGSNVAIEKEEVLFNCQKS